MYMCVCVFICACAAAKRLKKSNKSEPEKEGEGAHRARTHARFVPHGAVPVPVRCGTEPGKHSLRPCALACVRACRAY